jgi:predicted transcriptional regulator
VADAHELISLTADIVSAHVSHNKVTPTDLPGLISSIHDALAQLGQSPEPEAPKQEPAVSIRASVKHDYIVCLEDGQKLKMLKRYLRTNFNMTPEEYRQKWGLPRDYPMVAPAYAETRKELAKKIGLGRKPAAAPAPAAKSASKPKATVKPRAAAAPKAAPAAAESKPLETTEA